MPLSLEELREQVNNGKIKNWRKKDQHLRDDVEKQEEIYLWEMEIPDGYSVEIRVDFVDEQVMYIMNERASRREPIKRYPIVRSSEVQRNKEENVIEELKLRAKLWMQEHPGGK
jgi:hypothetical protein